tara:strand:- start:296 stop:622 length:327 start_codon:yes stop_codon:yes gene_type:complete
MIEKYQESCVNVIDFIEQSKMNFHKGTAVGLIVQSKSSTDSLGYPDADKEITDLRKAIWHLERDILLISENKTTSKISTTVDASMAAASEKFYRVSINKSTKGTPNGN